MSSDDEDMGQREPQEVGGACVSKQPITGAPAIGVAHVVPQPNEIDPDGGLLGPAGGPSITQPDSYTPQQGVAGTAPSPSAVAATPALDQLADGTLIWAFPNGDERHDKIRALCTQARAELSALRLSAHLAAEREAALRAALESTLAGLELAVEFHDAAIAEARSEGAFVPEEFGERQADPMRIAIRDGRRLLSPPPAATATDGEPQ